ncbi:SPOR domain-containing protein [Quisquiliibacterium transsilvanicum]|uniref:Cell division protein FtsN n=1 Tax=Quisquiliibacterium transsilvanicum TaxID=1549638 RepID=A0A7W8HIJ4_9BURK|nr:SPOR domain-containing protein [Quisquiliibacterium transsilvanicum]MBB5272568.1 cell division protein FtsN [Quisquiliibacterium transsilvanicum]
MARSTKGDRTPQSRTDNAARSRRPRSAVRGGTVLGFMIGLVIGLAIAVVVALFVTRAPVPFVNKAGRAPDKVLQPRTPADAPDPNAPLYSKNLPSPPPQPQETRGAPAPRDEGGGILERLFGRGAESEPGDADAGAAPVVASRPAAAPPAEPKAARPTADAPTGSGYLLQAGAFRGRDDAEGMRAKLALLGLEGRVLDAEVNGQPMYRVRIGPFAQLDELNNARARLAENGIEASVVRQR